MSKVSRLTNKETYIFKYATTKFAVTIHNIRNSYYSNPRYEANIIHISNSTADETYCFTPVYRFTGHYLSKRDEALWILSYVISKQKEDFAK